jgi:uncharacterized protein YjbI with pentapeptide repeats
MKIVKPMKLPVLTRVVERARKPELHVAAMLGFPLDAPRALFDELAFWALTAGALGENGAVDEGFAKARGELLVAGSFFAPGGAPLPASYVRARVGAADKRLAVLGDRVWKDQSATEPTPTASVPIDWAHAFGGAGWDKNPYGKGFDPGGGGDRGVPLPNVEHYGALLRSPADRPEPAGLLPMDVTFAQRRARAGTYDQRWLEQDFPGLAADAAPTFFNAAPEDQWIEGFFQGDEAILVENMHPDRPCLEGRLPGLAARCFVTLRTPEGERFLEIPLRWDTIWVFPSAVAGVLIAHGTLPVVEDDAEDVLHLVCACEEPAAPRPVGHYQRALARRLDKDKGAIAAMADGDLMPPRESGVAPNIEMPDVGRWTRNEGLQAKNLRRGAERRRASARASLEAAGIDPAAQGLDALEPEPAAPPEDLEALAAYLEAQAEEAKAKLAEAEEKVAKARAEAEARQAALGAEHVAAMEAGAKKALGPPKRGAAARALEAPGGGDAALRADVEEQEGQILALYRRTGHLQPTAPAMDPEAAARMRVLVELAIETGEGLAGRDLTGADLSEMSLRGMDLEEALLEAADLSAADLTGADLGGAVLAKATLRDADLSAARLRGANLGGADLGGAVLEGADLAEAVLSGADLAGARCKGATFTGAHWIETKLGAVDLSGAAMQGCKLMKADLRGARLAGADLTGATLVECALDRADLSGAVLEKATFVACKGEGASFRGARLRQVVVVHGSAFDRADFRDADMEKANLRGTSLTGARFDRAKLDGADLSSCDATGASLERASMKGVMAIRTRFDEASLKGANLVDALAGKARLAGADLTGANLYRADLSRVTGDARTRFDEADLGHARLLPKAEAKPGSLP